MPLISIKRIIRVAISEYIKIKSQKFLYISIFMLVVLTVVSAIFTEKLFGRAEKLETLHTVELFSYSFPTGLKLAILFTAIFASLSLSSEYERGTIRLLLTRPVTRIELFIGKVFVITCLALFFIIIAFYVSFMYGLIKGEMGVIWQATEPFNKVQWECSKIIADMFKAILISFLPALAAIYFAIFISSIIDHPGIAVAIVILSIFAFDIVLRFLGEYTPYFFYHFVNYPFDVLTGLSQALADARWNENFDKNLTYIKVPFLYCLGFLLLGYIRLKTRDILS